MHAIARRAGASNAASSPRSATVASFDVDTAGAAVVSATSGLERKVDISAANIFELPVAALPRKFQAIRKCAFRNGNLPFKR